MLTDYIQTSFASGEIGTSLYGRTDIAQYVNACAIVENMLIRPYGSAISTPGTRYVAETKYSTNGTYSTERLIPFVFNRAQSYIIEAGEKYFRFYTDGGQITTTGSVAVEIAHRYTAAEIQDIQFAQFNDVVYIAHKSHPPQRLVRYASNSWSISTLAFIGGPFLDDNTSDITLSTSATSGTIQVYLSATTSTIRFVPSVSSTNLGHYNTYWKMGETRTNATTGLDEQGYFKLTCVTSSIAATASVIRTLTTSAATTSWAEGAWSDVNGWPASVVFHESRLFFARTNQEPQKVWGSKSFTYDDFGVENAADDDAINIQLASNEANEIQWLAAGTNLIAGTYGGEFVISGGEDTGMTPSNVNAQKQTAWGSEPIVPKKIGNFFYYVQRFGKKLRELFYFWDLDTYKAVDKTILAPHILNDGVVDMTYQQNPDTILYCVLTNGTIATLTREQDQEVQGWARQTTSGTYTSISAIPSQSYPYDEVWVLVERTCTPVGSSSTNKRYIEYFENIEVPDRQDECFYLHSGLSYNAYTQSDTALTLTATIGTAVLASVTTTATTKFNTAHVGKRIRAIDSEGLTLGELYITAYSAATTVIGEVVTSFSTTSFAANRWGVSVSSVSGLSHLEARTVKVLGDGGLEKPDKTVTGGVISLAYDYFVVNAGLGYTQKLQTLPYEAGSQRGTSQGKIQKINQVGFKVNRSYKGFKAGGSEELAERINFRDPSTLMGTPEQLYTGVIPNITFNDDYRYGSQVWVINEDPLPVELLNIIASLDTNDK